VNPPRVVVPGSVAKPGLCTVQDGVRVDWRPVYADPDREFTILEGEGSLRLAANDRGRTRFAAGLVPIDPATVGDLESEGPQGEAVDAVLVAPAWLASSPLWVGELRLQRTPDGRVHYAGAKLHVVGPSGPAPEETATGAPVPAPAGVDPVLRGAPFVTLEGVVLGLYVGDQEGRPRAVPMALVREAATALDRHASR
jgi:hypothetical protein